MAAEPVLFCQRERTGCGRRRKARLGAWRSWRGTVCVPDLSGESSADRRDHSSCSDRSLCCAYVNAYENGHGVLLYTCMMIKGCAAGETCQATDCLCSLYSNSGAGNSTFSNKNREFHEVYRGFFVPFGRKVWYTYLDGEGKEPTLCSQIGSQYSPAALLRIFRV